jgi:endonuclease YncB( thermonuclease family)
MKRGLGFALLVLGALGGAFGYLGGCAWGGPLAARAIDGPAQVVDGDTLTLAGERIRLFGVDAPEARQMCERDGEPWRCGVEAGEALRGFLAGKPVSCTPLDHDRYGRVVARCLAAGQDVGAWLVAQGMAVAYTDFSWRYVPQELAARWHGRGLWAGRFVTPAEYRRGAR